MGAGAGNMPPGEGLGRAVKLLGAFFGLYTALYALQSVVTKALNVISAIKRSYTAGKIRCL